METSLDSEADVNPGTETLAANARAIAEAVKDPTERARVNKVVKERAFADFGKTAAIIGHGTVKNNWTRLKCAAPSATTGNLGPPLTSAASGRA